MYGEVARIHVQDDLVLANGKLDIETIQPLARLGYHDYTRVTEVFEMRIPGDNLDADAGLEGKA